MRNALGTPSQVLSLGLLFLRVSTNIFVSVLEIYQPPVTTKSLEEAMVGSTSSHSETTVAAHEGSEEAPGREKHRNGADVTSIWDARYANERRAIVKAFLTVSHLCSVVCCVEHVGETRSKDPGLARL